MSPDDTSPLVCWLISYSDSPSLRSAAQQQQLRRSHSFQFQRGQRLLRKEFIRQQEMACASWLQQVPPAIAARLWHPARTGM